MAEKDKEPTIIYSEQVKEQIAKDPKMAEFIRDFSARARQAMQHVEEGKHKDFGEAMKAQGLKCNDVDPGEDD